jgi:anti-sigma factor RsiW
MSRLFCAVASNFLTASVLSEARLTWPWRSHLTGCLRCQAHLASVKATRRRLGDMRFENVGLPSGFDQTVTSALGVPVVDSTIRGGSGRRAAAASAALAAVALAAAWMWRRAQNKSFEVGA